MDALGGWSDRLGEESHRMGQENFLPRSLSGGLSMGSLGSSSTHIYLLLWEKYNPKLLKYYRLQESDKSVSIGKLSKSKVLEGRMAGIYTWVK